MNSPLPIGVLIPTRNCVDRLRGQLASMGQWLDLASEVVVVDSQSTDGTIELLRSQLRHPNLRFLEHPPGLYESWNFGVRHISAEYCYFATAGDTISRPGLQHLFSTAETFGADVVLSKPAFVRENGQELPRKRWTIHHVLEELKVRSPARFSPARFFLTSALYGMAGVMGSSASNLYRTSALKARPFPTAFGHVGDTAWGVANAFETRVVISPEACAQFVVHENAGMVSGGREMETEAALLKLARETLRSAIAVGSVPPSAAGINEVLEDYEAIRLALRQANQDYDHWREVGWLWRLHYPALRARLRRNEQRRRLQQLWRQSLAAFNF